MKVIDEKGKLFGKLNVIDLIVIILIVAVLVVVGVKVIGADRDGLPSQSSAAATPGVLTYTVRVTAQSEEIAEFIAKYVDAETEKRDQLLTSTGLVDAYVVDFWTEPSKYNRLSSGLIDMLDAEQAEAVGLIDICFVIEASVEDIQYNLVGSQEVRVGKSHTVKTAHFELLNGVTVDCAWS